MAGLDRYWRTKLLMVKTETTSGTDSVPVAATNAIQAFNVTLTIEADEQTRNPEKSYYAVAETSYGNKRVSLSFDVELAGSGTADVAPATAPIFTLCQYSQTINASTSVVYTPVSSSTDTSTIYLNIDGTLYKTTYAKGSLKSDFNIGGYPRATITATGLYLTPADAALVAGVYTSFRAPIICSEASSVMSIHGTLVDGRSISFDQNNENTLHESTETKVIANTNRQPTCETIVWANNLSEFNPFTAWENHTKGVVYWETGTVAGDIIRLSMPSAQLGIPQPVNEDGVSGYNMSVLAHSDATGDNEHTYTFS